MSCFTLYRWAFGNRTAVGEPVTLFKCSLKFAHSALWLPRQTLSFTWPFTRIILTVTISVTHICVSLSHTQIHAIHFVQLIPEQSRPPKVTETRCPEINLPLPPFLFHTWEFSQSDSSQREKASGPADVRWGWGRKWETDTAGDKASPACPGLCLSLVSGCGGCARQRHTWHSNRPVKEQLRQRWDGGAWAHRGLVIPGWFTHWGEWQGTLKGFSHYA